MKHGAFLGTSSMAFAENCLIPGVEQTVRNISVKGVVLDPAGEPIIGASVLLKGVNGVGTITDVDGNFILSVPVDGVL